MDRDEFPLVLVRRQASHGCYCQATLLQEERNVHSPSCLVGQAQWYLGREVIWEILGKPALPPFRRAYKSEPPVPA